MSKGRIKITVWWPVNASGARYEIQEYGNVQSHNVYYGTLDFTDASGQRFKINGMPWRVEEVLEKP